MPKRRNILFGVGAMVAAGGAALSTGAFSTVTAERTVSVQTAGDADAFLSLEPAAGANGAFVTETDGTIQLNIDSNAAGEATTDNGVGLNKKAKTTFYNLVTVTNNGSQDVTSLTLEMSDSSDSNAGNLFKFTVDEKTLANANNGADILGSNGADTSLSPGSSVTFGLIIDLINKGNNGDLPNTDYTLTITAETSESQAKIVRPVS